MPRMDEPVPDFALTKLDGTLVRLADSTLSLSFGQPYRYFDPFFDDNLSEDCL